MFGFLSNVIGLIAIVANVKNKADIGLGICFISFLSVLLYVLIHAPLHINPVAFYENFYFLLVICIPAFICGATVFVFMRYVIEQNHLLAEQAQYDPLTGLANRRFAFEVIEKSVAFLRRKKSSYCIVMADVDHFKRVNDTYGHQAGDEVIRMFAKYIQDEVRRYDVACRFGGEEFLLFLSDTKPEHALKVAERMRQILKSRPIGFKDKNIPVTASFGVASAGSDELLESVIGIADKALYKAKSEGRDRVVQY
jgi:diguanylate cyclase (GGDEF)-like protein